VRDQIGVLAVRRDEFALEENPCVQGPEATVGAEEALERVEHVAQPGDRRGDLVVELADKPPPCGDDVCRPRARADTTGAVTRRRTLAPATLQPCPAPSELAALAGELFEMIAHQALEHDDRGTRIEPELRRHQRPDLHRLRLPPVPEHAREAEDRVESLLPIEELALPHSQLELGPGRLGF
jgi:hypothetical protein